MMKIFLLRKGYSISKTTAHKYMNKTLNLHAIVMKKKPVYVNGTKNKIFPNLIKQSFKVPSKNKVWCTDFTYIRLANGKMRYNCTIIDLFDRMVISSVNSDSINSDLAIKTLDKAIKSEKPSKGLIVHSDQGSQFTSSLFVDFCSKHSIIQSMSKAGCPYDNAPMERYYNTFKNELIYINRFHSEDHLDAATSRFAFVWYNHIRPHSYNNYLTPFEARYAK